MSGITNYHIKYLYIKNGIKNFNNIIEPYIKVSFI